MKNRRVQYFIDKPYQLRFSLLMLVLVIVSQIITIWYMAAIARLVLSDKFPAEALVEVWGEMKNEIWDNHRSKVIFLLGIDLLLAFIAGLFFSHQIAGPATSIKRVAEKFKEGDLSVTFKVRKGDSLQDVAAELNNSVLVYRNRISELKRLTDILRQSEKRLSSEEQEVLQEISRILGTLKTEPTEQG